MSMQSRPQSTVAVRLSAERALEAEASGDWSGVLGDSHLIERAGSEAPAIVDGETVLSYRDLDALVSSLTGGLSRLGVGRGEVVSWQLPNWHEALALHQAISRIGAVSNPIIPIYRRHEVEFILEQAQSRLFFAPQTLRGFDYTQMVDEMRPSLPHLEHLVVVRGAQAGGNLAFDDLLTAPPVAPDPDRSANDPVILLYTSGTTANPKGVLHTHNTLEYENRSLVELFDFSDRDRVFMPSPVSHITGLLYGMQLPFMLGTSVVLQEAWDPGVALRLIERHRCTFMVGATPFLTGLVYHEELADRDLGSMRLIWCGGADVPPQLVEDATERLGCFVTRVYGSSEFPTATISGPADPIEKRALTDGRPIASARVRIVDEDGGEVAAGTTGELLVRGPEMFCHYLVEPDEATFVDGWFATGDLGELDDDGFLTIRGRKKDIILRGGENISVKEVEDLLYAHPAVEEVAVVAMPDPIMTEKACAFVVPAPGRQLALADLTDFLRAQQLANQKLPERLELVDALPKNLAGKVQKFKLRETIREILEAERQG
jgi:cyclohexanecarboxylate-CoA ligase